MDSKNIPKKWYETTRIPLSPALRSPPRSMIIIIVTDDIIPDK